MMITVLKQMRELADKDFSLLVKAIRCYRQQLRLFSDSPLHSKFNLNDFSLILDGFCYYQYASDLYGDADPHKFFVFEDLKLAYLELPKVACTSIKTTIGRSYGISPANAMDIHEHPSWHQHLGLLNGVHRSYYTFAFVRNPFERLVSCYRDKVIYSGSNEIYSTPYFQQYYYFPIPANIPFSEFVERVARIPDCLADRHFKSQSAFLYHQGKLLVDYVGKFEALARDWKTIAVKYGFDTELDHQHTTKAKRGAHHDYRTYYTKELAQLVYQRYKADVELFGYQAKYRELMDYLCDKSEASKTGNKK